MAWLRRLSFHQKLGAITAVGLIIRLAAVLSEQPIRFLTDEYWYLTQAQRLGSAHAFTDPVFGYPTALHAPLGAILASPTVHLFRHALTSQRLVSVGIGTSTVWLLGILGRQLGSPTSGLFAAALGALSPDLWMSSGVLTSDAAATSLLVVVVLVATRGDRVTRRQSVFLGLILGLTVLANSEFALLGVAIIVVFMWFRRHRFRNALDALSHLVVVGAIAVAVLSPWLAYNHHRFHHVVLTTNLGQTLAGSDNHDAFFGTSIGYQSILPPVLHVSADLQSNEPAMDALQRQTALHYVHQHLGRFFEIIPLRIATLWSWYQPGLVANRESLSGYRVGEGWLQAAWMWLATPVAVWAAWRVRKRRDIVLLAVVLFGFATLTGVLINPSLRYRTAGIVALIVLVAVGATAPRDSTS